MAQADSISTKSTALATLPQLTVATRYCRRIFLEHKDVLTKTEREELSALRTAGEVLPHVQRSTEEIACTLEYQRRILREQSRAIRFSAKRSLVAGRAVRAHFTRAGSYDCACIRSGLRVYIDAWRRTREFVRTLEAELERRSAVYAAAAE